MTEKLRDQFQYILNYYLKSKTESLKSHPIADLVCNQVTSNIRELSFIKENYSVTGSVGKGNWAYVPWIAIMNKVITNSTQRGYYIVYLFSEDMKKLYLSFAQGVTETSIYDMDIIKNEIKNVISIENRFLKDDKIFLGQSNLAKKYSDSTAIYIEYNADNLPVEEQLITDLKDMISYYDQYILYKNDQRIPEPDSNEKSDDSSKAAEITGIYIPQKELVDHIYSYIRSKGFYYEKNDVANLFLSLKSKPFVIISGISGTGKTKIVQWFAESVGATEENGQLSLIPVRPDWSDGSDLLGYIDIKSDFKSGPLTTTLIQAIANPTKPFFVLLDEMNLARVEYYFSDLLSIMESRKWKDGELVTSSILTVEGKPVYLPGNVYIIGTVNMDETTHPFSKKVLDRANTLEFNRIKLDHLDFLKDLPSMEPQLVTNRSFATKYLHLTDVYASNADLVESVSAELIKINEVLEILNAQVGYRVRDEICFYMANNSESGLLPFNTALDLCILQKILPRVSGSDGRVELALKGLYKIFNNKELLITDSSTKDLVINSKYPRSSEKLVTMMRRLEEDGFTSFWI